MRTHAHTRTQSKGRQSNGRHGAAAVVSPLPGGDRAEAPAVLRVWFGRGTRQECGVICFGAWGVGAKAEGAAGLRRGWRERQGADIDCALRLSRACAPGRVCPSLGISPRFAFGEAGSWFMVSWRRNRIVALSVEPLAFRRAQDSSTQRAMCVGPTRCHATEVHSVGFASGRVLRFDRGQTLDALHVDQEHDPTL
eukprot:172507-Prymnesium_polylepis.1